MLQAYVPILLFVLIAIGFAVATLLFAGLVRPSRYGKVKLEPYECGIEPLTDARDRYSIRYYLVAMLFVIFDVETVFLYPWAVAYSQLPLFALFEMLLFIAILTESSLPPDSDAGHYRSVSRFGEGQPGGRPAAPAERVAP